VLGLKQYSIAPAPNAVAPSTAPVKNFSEDSVEIFGGTV
jgi:hypothetical protein